MHPLTADRRRFGLYLLAWGFAGAALAWLLVMSGRFPWLEAVALGLPLCLLYAFISLSAFYLCRAVPLRDAGVPRLLATHSAAAAVASALWVLMGRGWALVLDHGFAGSGLSERFTQVVPLFSAVGALLFLLAVAVHYVMAAAEASRLAEKQALELQVWSKEAELKTLRAQLHPHFLFNSLNSISALTTVNPERAREMCLLLGDLLRRSLSLGAKDLVGFAEELAWARRFLEVEGVRFGARLGSEFQVDSAVDEWPTPPLLLQPLVENAVTHGIAGMVEGGVVRIEARSRGGLLEIAVENPCDPQRTTRSGAGVGIENVRRRLEAVYGREASLTVKETDGRFRAELRLPRASAAHLPGLRSARDGRDV
ncbi:MAG TPA: histidine kinase [Vicinamibacteria bacterium]|nr:histidine kinase [Vicinamibacteria bacterium]